MVPFRCSPLAVRKEELVYRRDPEVELLFGETVVGLEEERLSLVEEEHGSPEVKTANLGCL